MEDKATEVLADLVMLDKKEPFYDRYTLRNDGFVIKSKSPELSAALQKARDFVKAFNERRQ